ncbi:hypothetical protein BU16DRAFT_576709 [Lophium mytilinum]|uniref:Uncharacterized protein n=1 Tax=Lophium mytilinum TaxID=390894 RepID=A0A6A6RH46_9PEZI|nr:hypothetical protein BU16DRAFT_576709 [Lophium mytilinum]
MVPRIAIGFPTYITTRRLPHLTFVTFTLHFQFKMVRPNRGLKASTHEKRAKDSRSTLSKPKLEARVQALPKRKKVLGEKSGNGEGSHRRLDRGVHQTVTQHGSPRSVVEDDVRQMWDRIVWGRISDEALRLSTVREDEMDTYGWIPTSRVPLFHEEVASVSEKLFTATGGNFTVVPAAIATKVGSRECAVAFQLSDGIKKALGKDPRLQGNIFKISQILSLDSIPAESELPFTAATKHHIGFSDTKPAVKPETVTKSTNSRTATKDEVKIKVQNINMSDYENDTDVPDEELVSPRTQRHSSGSGRKHRYRYPKDLEDFIAKEEETHVKSDESYEDGDSEDSDGSFSVDESAEDEEEDELLSDDEMDI